MHDVAVPRLNGNDDTCRLVEWAHPDGATIDEESVVAVVETSKAAADILSGRAGILHSSAEVGAECRVGEVIGYVFTDERERQEFLRTRASAPAAGPGRAPLVLTGPARRLSERAGLTEDQLRALDLPLIRETDVEQLLARIAAPAVPVAVPAVEAADSVRLAPRQRAVGAVVTRSHRTVPDAFAAVAVPCDALLERLQASNAEHGRSVGLPEVVIAALAGLRPEFPDFFGWLDGEDRLLRPGPGTDIGVTVDVGTGLFVPVVKDAGTLGPTGIAERLMEFRYKAMRQSFQDADLTGGQLSVALAMEAGVLVSVPIIQSPQVCMVSLTAVRTGIELDEQDRPVRRRELTVGLAYDHRVINGREAVQFLTALRSALGRPAELGL